MYHVYILLCSDGSLYVGYTRNPGKGLQKHNEGLGVKYTSKRRPTVLVYSESHDSEVGALHRERQLKRWTRNKKEALIRGDLDLLRSLSKRRN